MEQRHGEGMVGNSWGGKGKHKCSSQHSLSLGPRGAFGFIRTVSHSPDTPGVSTAECCHPSLPLSGGIALFFPQEFLPQAKTPFSPTHYHLLTWLLQFKHQAV